MEEIILKTLDGVQIYGDYYETEKSNTPAVLLLHMMPSTKKSWREFAQKLQKEGFQALAIDFRGHGKSVFKDNHSIDYKIFTDMEHQQKIHDIETAIKFLIDTKNPSFIFLIGASIGANLTVQYMALHTRILGGVLLSPGINYHGVESNTFITKLDKDQALYIVASKDDAYSAESAQELYDIAKIKKEIKILDNAGHGTNMFSANPELMDEIIGWMKNL